MSAAAGAAALLSGRPELWDVYDRAGRRTGRRIERTASMAPGDFHLAAELWLSDADGRLLIQQRAATRRVLPGVWAMTTGCMLAGEASRAGVLREAREELGLSLPDEALIFLERIVRPEAGTLWDLWAARLSVRAPALRLDPVEVADARWITPDALRERIFVYPEMGRILARWETLG
ncbi:MAG: NUDIX domain-containing protein [Oscillospiraceae bacterium]